MSILVSVYSPVQEKSVFKHAHLRLTFQHALKAIWKPLENQGLKKKMDDKMEVQSNPVISKYGHFVPALRNTHSFTLKSTSVTWTRNGHREKKSSFLFAETPVSLSD